MRWGPRAWDPSWAVLNCSSPPLFPPRPPAPLGSGRNSGLCSSLLLSFTSLLDPNLSLASAQEETGQGEAAGTGTSTSWHGARTRQRGELGGAGEGHGAGHALLPQALAHAVPSAWNTLHPPPQPPLGMVPLHSSSLSSAHSFQDPLALTPRPG